MFQPRNLGYYGFVTGIPNLYGMFFTMDKAYDTYYRMSRYYIPNTIQSMHDTLRIRLPRAQKNPVGIHHLPDT